ncbi:(2Fe-2S) ferredoxin domain-containing protein [Flavobacterium sp. xlx-214]|uniref:(2Fe-2S) ferredoxin domain-containing protein n=1 Tax=unclassified Flavobacterium TaxID=196869 RepID=UPI0013D1889C|nr:MULTISPECIES: (2Fe-2S) ferredoxin domain-containing protein [unclassified Flavobacterium]MBA5793726.1 (2Fe-2S) ferredoxin domain-containing protein [Flavobacterium sp. xlx-221]QMI83253.1 (2Fe-2S) ferredoxin domain-containing protein [Flavobacterium sp. xlx-214]
MSKCNSLDDVIYFCDGKKCCRYNEEAKSCIKSLLSETGLNKSISLEKMKCQGMCKSAPVFYIDSEKKYKKEVTKKKAKKIFDKYFIA